jgi:hypothetical protein
MRSCVCDRIRTGPFTEDQCRRCWLYHNDPWWKAKWDGGVLPPVPKPGLFRRALNLAGAVTQHVLAGMPTVPDEVYQQRMGVCEKCPHLTPEKKCGACGCDLAIKGKWADQSCPVCERCGNVKWKHPPECGSFKPKWPALTLTGTGGCGCGRG